MIQKKQTKKSNVSVGKVVGVTAGVAALGAGAYYFLGPNGKKNQKKAKVWMNKIKKDTEKKITKIKNVSEPIYHSVVDTIVANYSKQYKEHAPEIKAFAKDLKSEWNKIEKKSKPIIKKVQKKVKKELNSVKKVTNKKKAKK